MRSTVEVAFNKTGNGAHFCRLMASKPCVGIASVLSVCRYIRVLRHYWEVDIAISESAKKFDLG
jgi:hypothetical protein